MLLQCGVESCTQGLIWSSIPKPRALFQIPQVYLFEELMDVTEDLSATFIPLATMAARGQMEGYPEISYTALNACVLSTGLSS